MLSDRKPSTDDYDKYDKKKKRRSRDELPWGLLLLLLVTAAAVLYTRQRSPQAAQSHHQPEEIANDQTQSQNEQPKGHSNLKYREDADAFAGASAVFNATLHETYKASLPLPPLTEDLAKGGWPYTKAIYDLSAYHSAADVLSWEKPRLVRFKSFLTPQEVGHLVAVAKERLERSEVLTTNQSEAVQDIRTSYGAWPPSDEVTNEIVDRIHRLVGIPTEFGEGIYVLNYQHGQNYAAHTDSVVDTYRKRDAPIDEASRGFLERAGGPHCGYGHGGSACGDRIATFILYLKSPEIGGKTVFPKAEATQRAMESSGVTFDEFLNPQGEIEDLWYCNRTEALGVAPDAGDGILFWSYVPWGGAGTGSWDNQTADPMATGVLESEHSGCPVWGGEKWIATRWIRSAQFI